MLAIDFDIGDVVFEDGWDVDLHDLESAWLYHGAERIRRVDVELERLIARNDAVGRLGAGRSGRQTSGKVPLEKTLSDSQPI